MREAIRFVAGLLWRWDVVGICVGLLFGVGLSAMYGNDYMVAAGCYIAAISWVTAKIVTWSSVTGHSNRKQITILILLVAFVVLSASVRLDYYRFREVELAPTSYATLDLPAVFEKRLRVPVPPLTNPPQEPRRGTQPIEISFNCTSDLDGLPIKVSVGTTGHIFFLNPLVNAQVRSVVLYEIDNVTGDSPKQWPDPRTFSPEIVTKEREKGKAFAYRCEVTNFGRDDVFELNIPIQIGYGVSPDSPQLTALSHFYTNTIVVNPLIRGNTFRFYLVNPCPVEAEMLLPRDGKARLVSEHAIRPFQFALENPYASSQGLQLNPSDINWSQVTCFDTPG